MTDDGQYLAILTSGGHLSVTLRARGFLHGLVGQAFGRRFQEIGVSTICISPSGRTLVTGGEDGVLRIRILRDEVSLRNGRKRVAFSGDGRMVVAVGESAVLDARTGEAIEQWLPPLGVERITNSQPGCIDISPDGRYITDGVELIDRVKNQRTFPFSGFSSPSIIKGLAFSPDSRLLGKTGSRAGTIFELDPPRLQAALLKPSSSGFISGRWVSCVKFSPDGRTFAVGFNTIGDGGCGEVQLWDTASNRLLFVLDRHSFSVWDLAFSPDGKSLAGACGSFSRGRTLAGEVRVWDVRTGRQLVTLGGFSECVWSVSFSPDGRRLAAGSGDRGLRDEWAGDAGEVRVWDLAANQVVVSLKQASPVYGVAYSPDRMRFAHIGLEGMGRVWGPP
jgi:WD40 repeat protein